MSTSLLEFADKMDEIVPTLIKGFHRRQINELYRGKITLPQFLILDFLVRQGDSTMTNLARFMGVSTAAVTGIVDRLVKCGYILRSSYPADRRIINIKLTLKGINLVSKINEQRRQTIIKVFGRISQSERETYLKILMRIKDILSEEKKVLGHEKKVLGHEKKS